jgi:hypothetical protein
MERREEGEGRRRKEGCKNCEEKESRNDGEK